MSRVAATLGNSMASVSAVTMPRYGSARRQTMAQLRKAARAPQPLDQPQPRLGHRLRAVGEQVAEQEVAGEVEALRDGVPIPLPAFQHEARQGQQPTGI